MSKEEKARIARENGAKSKGPKTTAGHERCRQAAAKPRPVAITFDCTLLPTESRESLDSITAQEFAYWQPATPTQSQLVHELIDINWKIKRIRFAQTQALLNSMEAQRQRASAPELAPEMLAKAVIEGAAQLQLDRHAAILSTVRARILRDLERLAKRFSTSAGSQHALQTNHLPAETSWRVPATPPQADSANNAFTYAANPDTLHVPPPAEAAANPASTPEPKNILDWARKELNFHADHHQAAILNTQAKNVLVLGARQTGKSTAAAVRIVHEAVNHPESTILLAGPTGRQSGQIMDKARKIARHLGLSTGAPPPGCDGFKLPNGSHIISLPDSEATIRGFSAPRLIVVDEAAFVSDELFNALKPMLAVSNGAMYLLSTPNGQSGYFYEKWHETGSHWEKILVRATECARITPEALEDMRQTLTKTEFSQEFLCEFLPANGQIFDRNIYRRNIRHDIQPMFEEENDY